MSSRPLPTRGSVRVDPSTRPPRTLELIDDDLREVARLLGLDGARLADYCDGDPVEFRAHLREYREALLDERFEKQSVAG